MQSEKISLPDPVQNISIPLLLSCPVCHEQLTNLGRIYQCPKGHTFDIAKQGYVNLLLAHQRKSKQPGDSKEMILSRAHFLNQGYYQPISEKVNEAAMACFVTGHHSDSGTILDIGCGEGYYLSRLHEAFVSHPLYQGACHHFIGLDISKAAIHEATRRNKHITWIIASVASLPLLDASCSLLLNIFAPINVSEFTRVLEPHGKLILVTPGPSHLYELRTLLYKDVVENKQEDVLDRTKDFFTVSQCEHVTFDISLANASDIMSLYRMTPFFWKTSPEAHARVEQLETLKTHADVFVRTLQKQGTRT
jgi:23S rRNA (guanine745-N1)-methyltransferase